MSRSTMVYRECGRRYAPDTCAELARAARRGEVELSAWTSGHYPGHKLPRGWLPGLRTVGCWDASRAQRWGLGWHRNEGVEIALLEGGRLPFAVDDGQHMLEPGSLTITRPWQRHRVGDPHVTPGRLHWLILDVGVRRPHQAWTWPPWVVLSRPDLHELTVRLRHNEQPTWHASDDLRASFKRIAQGIEREPTGESVSWLTLQLNELFLHLLRLCRGATASLDASLPSSVRTVELFLAELADDPRQLAQEWTLPRMAAHCGLGITRFVHHCRKLSGSTPVDYLVRCRLQQARQQLVERPELSIVEVAGACGFGSSQYFATRFGREFGLTPSAWRLGRPQIDAAN